MDGHRFDVYFSYSSQRDGEGRDNYIRVKEIKDGLQSTGLLSWFDKEVLTKKDPEQWSLEMKTSLQASSCVLLCLSKDYVELTKATFSNSAKWELQKALNKSKGRVIVAVMESQLLQNYRWISILTGSEHERAMVFDFSNADSFSNNLGALKIEIQKQKSFVQPIELLDIKMDTYRRSVCLLGSTGTGKSSVANLLSSSNEFKVGHGTDSCTENCSVYEAHWSPHSVDIIDTPGFGDVSNRDDIFSSKIVETLKERQNIGCLFIVLNCHDKRFHAMTQKTITNFQAAFPLAKDFYRNLGIIITHWGFSDAEERKREVQEITKEKREQQLIKELRKIVTGAENHEFPCFFLDSLVMDKIEKERQNVELEKLKFFILEKCNDPIDCRNLAHIQEEERAAKEAASFKQMQFNNYEPKPLPPTPKQEIISAKIPSYEDIIVGMPGGMWAPGNYPGMHRSRQCIRPPSMVSSSQYIRHDGYDYDDDEDVDMVEEDDDSEDCSDSEDDSDSDDGSEDDSDDYDYDD